MEYTNTGLSIVSQNICLAEVDNVDWSCDMSEQEVHGKSENQSRYAERQKLELVREWDPDESLLSLVKVEAVQQGGLGGIMTQTS